MPTGMKPAPPQQSKLEEMWGKKKKSVKEEEDVKMDVEPVGTFGTRLQVASRTQSQQRKVRKGSNQQVSISTATANLET